MKNDLTYDEVYSQLEKLVSQIEDDTIQLDTLAKKVAQANDLIAVCENKLRTIETDVAKKLKVKS